MKPNPLPSFLLPPRASRVARSAALAMAVLASLVQASAHAASALVGVASVQALIPPPPPLAPAGESLAPQRQELLRASLQSFMPEPKPIELRNASSEYVLFLPIAARMQVKGATLYLVANNSVSLISPRSQLVVRLGGIVVAQIALDSRLPQIRASIRLPAELLKPAYNRLTFAVAQHYTNECEDPSAAELWTQIDTAKSWIALDGELKSWSPTLAGLGDVFDPKMWGPQRLTVLTPGGALTADTLRQGSLAAQAAALRLGYAPLEVRQATARPSAASATNIGLRIDPASVPTGDAMLVGTAAQLAPLLAPSLAAQIRAPFLAVLPLDAASRRFVVVASGQDPAQVALALQALDALNFPYPDAAQMTVDRLEAPRLPDYAGRNMLYTNQSKRFDELGLRTYSFQGRFAKDELKFVLPPDLYAPENASVELKLRFAYGAGLREDSVLNILLNDRFQAAIRLDAASGGYFESYNISIPLASFKPGANVIRFESAMMPLISGKCQDINAQNLQFTLFEQSTIKVPNAAHVTSLPDLSLFGRSGFPYTVPARAAQTSVLVASADAQTVASAWTLLGRLSQVQKLPLDGLDFAVGTQNLPAGRDLIVVGAADQIAPAVLARAPLPLGTRTRAPYPSNASAAGPGELGWFAQWWRGFTALFHTAERAAVVPEVTWLTQPGLALGGHAALMQFESPAGAGRTLTLLVAATPQTLLAQTTALVDPGVWAGMAGDLMVWNGSADLAAQRVGPEYTRGSSGLGLQISFVVSRHPWLWGVALVVLVLGLALLTLRMLLRFKHRRHPAVVDDRPQADLQ